MPVKIKVATVEVVVPTDVAADGDKAIERWISNELSLTRHHVAGICEMPLKAVDVIGPKLFEKTQLATLVKAAVEARRYLDKTPCAKSKEQVLRLLDKALK